jgi:uncharacterized protein YyaL (SSP411 family)
VHPAVWIEVRVSRAGRVGKDGAVPNRLSSATSPYLLQHADNPVDWYEWGDEAFEAARERDLPILLSVGYAACHWCHVMAHESFEDTVTASVMNANFINIKVDREERPDVDAIYMQATQAMTGHGGWPMTVFLDHERRPFFAGTYFPPEPVQGMPAFMHVLHSISEAWRERRGEVAAAAERISGAAFRDMAPILREQMASTPWSELTAEAVRSLDGTFDATFGGFGGAPKFPPSMALEFLLRHWWRTRDQRAFVMCEQTLESMARGGIYDQLGGGIARYSVDAQWVVPHFEKMLYDNALLIRVYLHWWAITDSALAKRVVEESIEWLWREMRTPEGGFASSLDADSLPEGGAHPEEGAFYAWSRAPLIETLGEDAARAAELFAVTPTGTFEHGLSTLQLLEDAADQEWFEGVRDRLFRRRAQRPAPGRDDKVITAWNGLTIAALAEAGALMERPEWLTAARDCAELLLRVHGDGTGRLLRVSRDGVVHPTAHGLLEDHAYLAEGLLALYESTGEVRWLDEAGLILTVILDRFEDGDDGFYDTADDAPEVTAGVRPRDPGDGATPSAWAVAASALLTYSTLVGDLGVRARAERALGIYTAMAGSPRWAGWALATAEAIIDGPREVAIIGPDHAMHRAALAAPLTVVARGRGGEEHPALLADRPMLDRTTTAYVCRNFVCGLPVTSIEALQDQLRSRE